jgi:predicted small metal-binding protein
MSKPAEQAMTRPLRFYVEADMCMDNEGEGIQLLSYSIEASGDSLAELIDDALIHEATADGITVITNGLYDYAPSVVRRGEEILAEAFMKGGNKG